MLKREGWFLSLDRELFANEGEMCVITPSSKWDGDSGKRLSQRPSLASESESESESERNTPAEEG